MGVNVATVLVAAAWLGGVASGHDWGWGACPTVEPFPNFAVDKFLGEWYVIQQFDTTSTCLTLNYTRSSPTQLKVTKSRQLLMLDTLSIEHLNTYTATLDIPDGEKAAAMRAKWPLNLAGKNDYIVLDTDYTTYAGVYECQAVSTLLHRKSAAILSRTPYLEPTFIDRVKRRLTSSGIEVHDFDEISHDSCTEPKDSDVNINVDEETFKKVMNQAADGVRTIATQLVRILQVAEGATDLASSVVDLTKRLSQQTAEPDPNPNPNADAEIV